MAYVSQERPQPRGLPTWTVDFSFGGLDESARARLYKRQFFSGDGSTCNFHDNSDSDDEIVDFDELKKIFTRTYNKPAPQPRVGLSRDEKRMTARGYIVDTVNAIVSLPQPKPGNIDESFVSDLATVLDRLLGHCFAAWGRTKPRVVVDQIGTSLVRAPPESRCDWKRMLTNVERTDLRRRGLELEPELLTEYQYRDDKMDESFRNWRIYSGLPTFATRLGIGWSEGVCREWETHRWFELGDRVEGTVFFITAKGFNMAVDDHIVLLHGCNDVMLLRQRSRGYDYQGTVYIHSISNGEMDDLFDSGAFEEEDFCLV